MTHPTQSEQSGALLSEEHKLRPTLEALYSWWVEACDAATFPDREAFDPLSWPRLLPTLIMVATAKDLPDFKFLVYGTELANQFGEERTGKRFGEIKIMDNKEQTLMGYRIAQETGKPHYFTDRYIDNDKRHQKYDRLLLPLGPADEEGKPTRILGIIEFYCGDGV